MSKSTTTKTEPTGKTSPLKPVKASTNDDLDLEKQARIDAQEQHDAKHSIIEEMILDREAVLRHYLSGIVHLAASELDEYGRLKKRGLYRQFATEKRSTAEDDYPIMPAEKMRLYGELLWSLMQDDLDQPEKVIEGKSPTYRFNLFSDLA